MLFALDLSAFRKSVVVKLKWLSVNITISKQFHAEFGDK